MKTRILTSLIFIFVFTGFMNIAPEQEHTYQLTITSVNEEQHKFNVEISSKKGSSSESTKVVLTDQITPFEKVLEVGEHIIIVEHLGEKGHIITKIMTILNGKTTGGVTSDDSMAILKAGPDGRCSVNQ